MRKKNKHLKSIIFSMSIILIICFNSFDNEINASDNTFNEESIKHAINWLALSQYENGTWGLNGKEYLDTSDVTGVLGKYAFLDENRSSSIAWINRLNFSNNDIRSRNIYHLTEPFSKEANKKILLNSQNSDGGWGIDEGYQSDLLDTLLVMETLVKLNTTEIESLKKGFSYILKQQNNDGSWTVNKCDDMSIKITAKTILLLKSVQNYQNLLPVEIFTALNNGSSFLLSKQYSDQTWGTDKVKIEDTLFAYEAILWTGGLSAVETTDHTIINMQNANGSWFDDPRLTALAIDSLMIKNKKVATVLRV